MDAMRRLGSHLLKLGPGGMHCPCCTDFRYTEQKRHMIRVARRRMKQDLKKEITQLEGS